MEPDVQALPGGTMLADQYEVVETIGMGGFGMVYLCEDHKQKRQVAVKEYFPRQWAEREEEYVVVKQSEMVNAFQYGMASFEREGEILALVGDIPQVADFYGKIKANDTVYLVMEYIPGISVGRTMRRRNYKPYTPREMAKILLPLLDGLDKLHERGVVHSDISPANIMLGDRGQVRLIDLGAARRTDVMEPVLSAAFLKPDYAAPEQYRTALAGIPRQEGPWTDIYGVGATMYFLLTGHKPVNAISRLSGTSLVDPGEYHVRLSKKWRKLIDRAMELEGRDRFQSAQELSREIRKLSGRGMRKI